MHLIGDVRDKDCIIVDDLIDTAGTLCNAARAVMNGGARRVFACATHGVLSGPAVQRIEESPLEQVVVTNSIAPSPETRASKKIRYISIARLLGEAIRRIHNSDSVSSLFV
jgi:ribose-phosphate pyrophosphokinase